MDTMPGCRLAWKGCKANCMAVTNTLEKLRRLERYVSTQDAVDSVLEMTLEKLVRREIERLQLLRNELHTDLTTFEKTYGLDSATFYGQYEVGALGDAIDFVEWSSTVDMLENLDRHLQLLQSS